MRVCVCQHCSVLVSDIAHHYIVVHKEDKLPNETEKEYGERIEDGHMYFTLTVEYDW